jgi:allophanate hydrolase subunit 2
VVLRCRPGPRADWCRGDLRDLLATTTYVASSDSDRVGLRLQGPPLQRRDGELPSEGIVLGAVQLPPDGQPVIFLNDHPTTGGYPVVAVVVPADLPRCAQVRPGDEVALSPRSVPGPPGDGWP